MTSARYKTFLQGPLFQRLVLLVCLISSGLVIFSQKNVDAIVNGTMYHYGLQFSNNWAQPYWAYEHLLYASQFVSIALGTVALAFGFLKKENGDKHTPKHEKTNNELASKREQNIHEGISEQEKPTGSTTGISCPKCKRTLSKPLVMMDFAHGKPKLINVCPYCNNILGKAEEQNDTEIIVDPEKEIARPT